jgi:hypothetical protein
MLDRKDAVEELPEVSVKSISMPRDIFKGADWVLSPSTAESISSVCQLSISVKVAPSVVSSMQSALRYPHCPLKVESEHCHFPMELQGPRQPRYVASRSQEQGQPSVRS